MSKAKTVTEQWSETQVFLALQKRYSEPEWILLRNVRNAVGYAGKEERYADAIALNLWPSRGLEVVGFEIKSYRQDWLKELAHPEKSAPIQRFCNRWFVAVGDESIVHAGELPSTWGLMIPARNEKLRVKTEAPALKPEEMSKKFVLSLVRSAMKVANPPEMLQKQLSEARQAGIEIGNKAAQHYVESAQKRLTELEARIKTFEAASGVSLSDHWGGERIGAAVKLVIGTNVAVAVQYQRDTVKRLLVQLEEAVAELENM